GVANSRPAPVIVFHGDADATVAPANGDAVIAATLAASGTESGSAGPSVGVALSDGVSERAGGDAATRSYRRTVWRRANVGDGPSLAELWQVQGAGHAWSGGAAAGSYTDPRGPDASREMLRFFAEHPLPTAV
ncbi:MAG: hypothetical protein M3Z16_01350, partial [Pseudomonadota bacterium]|nr:hypothetical protein [Pseudomonadota bacterium]